MTSQSSSASGAARAFVPVPPPVSAPTSDFVGSSARAIDLLLGTAPHLAGPILRVFLAVVMFAHGAQKAFGWFGGYGWAGTMGFLTGTIGLPAALAVLVVLLEVAGPLALLAGLGTRTIALGFIAIMAGAIVTTHAPYGFFMNWSGQQGGEGFELHLLVIGMSLALLASGAGRYSLDRRIATAARA